MVATRNKHISKKLKHFRNAKYSRKYSKVAQASEVCDGFCEDSNIKNRHARWYESREAAISCIQGRVLKVVVVVENFATFGPPFHSRGMGQVEPSMGRGAGPPKQCLVSGWVVRL